MHERRFSILLAAYLTPSDISPIALILLCTLDTHANIRIGFQSRTTITNGLIPCNEPLVSNTIRFLHRLTGILCRYQPMFVAVRRHPCLSWHSRDPTGWCRSFSCPRKRSIGNGNAIPSIILDLVAVIHHRRVHRDEFLFAERPEDFGQHLTCLSASGIVLRPAVFGTSSGNRAWGSRCWWERWQFVFDFNTVPVAFPETIAVPLESRVVLEELFFRDIAIGI